MVYAVSHKLLAQVTSKRWFALEVIKLQREHTVLMGDRGTLVVRGELAVSWVPLQHVVLG